MTGLRDIYCSKPKTYYVYILSNWNGKVIYVGVTSDLEKRVWEHRHKVHEGFTAKYNVNRLVYFEHSTDAMAAIAREKQIKKWSRHKKDALIQSVNSEWKDLSEGWFEE